MDIDIRKYINDNFKEESSKSIKETIIESIKSKDDVTLPGIGVMFELVWNNSNSVEQDEIINKIKKALS